MLELRAGAGGGAVEMAGMGGMGAIMGAVRLMNGDRRVRRCDVSFMQAADCRLGQPLWLRGQAVCRRRVEEFGKTRGCKKRTVLTMQVKERADEKLTLKNSLFVVLASLAISICYADRANIADAILPMSAELGFARSVEGIVLSSFFIGYASTQIAGGWLSDKFGGKNILSAAVVLWSIATMLTPSFARSGLYSLILIRVLMGVGEGPAFPAIHSMISRTIPDDRKTTAVAIVTAASYVGSLLAFAVCPTIIASSRWDNIFFSFGSLGLAWLPLWFLYTRFFPSIDKRPVAVGDVSADAAAGNDILGITRSLLLKKEVWAIIVAQYTQSWVGNTFVPMLVPQPWVRGSMA
eukprot:752303-Hanusia_phi.AAC.7